MSLQDRGETAFDFEERSARPARSAGPAESADEYADRQALQNDPQQWQDQQDQQDQQDLYELDESEETLPNQRNVTASDISLQILKGGVFLLFALAAGWVGGRWANAPDGEEPPPVSQTMLVEPVVLSQKEIAPPSAEGAKGRAYLGIRGKGVQVGELRNVGFNDSGDAGDAADLDTSAADTAFAGLAAHLDTPQQKALLVQLQELYEDLSRRSAGVKITEVFPDSPAARAGLRADEGPVPPQLRKLGSAGGHIIIGANGHLVRSEDDLARQLTLSTPGAPMELLVSAADGTAYEVILVTLGADSDKPVPPQTAQTRPLEEGIAPVSPVPPGLSVNSTPSASAASSASTAVPGTVKPDPTP